VKVRYGRYEHDNNEVQVRISSEPVRSSRGVIWGFRRRILLTGELHASDQSSLAEKIEELTQAYSIDGGDFRLLFDSGGDSPDSIRNSEAIGDIRIVRAPSFQNPLPGEYSTFRNYDIELEAIVGALPGQNLLLEFSETINVRGTGGPSYRYLKQAGGLAQKQRTYPTSLVRATQSGRAVGLIDYPMQFVPPPRWPDAIVDPESVDIAKLPPEQNYGPGQYSHFPVTWSYPFESNGPLPGDDRPSVI
jgi:hypothetical protein